MTSNLVVLLLVWLLFFCLFGGFGFVCSFLAKVFFA